jgi:hypothetical protein
MQNTSKGFALEDKGKDALAKHPRAGQQVNNGQDRIVAFMIPTLSISFNVTSLVPMSMLLSV